MTIISDKTLSQKIERANGRSNADFVESRAKLFPESGSEWIEVAGVYAMFDAVDSPTTQTFGLGLFDKITDVEMNMIEAFFKERNTSVNHEVSPLADPKIFPILNSLVPRFTLRLGVKYRLCIDLITEGVSAGTARVRRRRALKEYVDNPQYSISSVGLGTVICSLVRFKR